MTVRAQCDYTVPFRREAESRDRLSVSGDRREFDRSAQACVRSVVEPHLPVAAERQHAAVDGHRGVHAHISVHGRGRLEAHDSAHVQAPKVDNGQPPEDRAREVERPFVRREHEPRRADREVVAVQRQVDAVRDPRAEIERVHERAAGHASVPRHVQRQQPMTIACCDGARCRAVHLLVRLREARRGQPPGADVVRQQVVRVTAPVDQEDTPPAGRDGVDLV